jgi:LPXTG-motif cell wall-anchored protein
MLATGVSLGAFALLAADIAIAVAQPYPIRRASVTATAVQNNDNNEDLNVRGGGFASGANVQLGLDGEGEHAAAAQPVTMHTDAVGNFRGKVRLPRALRPGRHTVTAHGAAPSGGTAIGSAPFVVGGRARTVAGGLPYTGAHVIAGVVLGALALAGGTAAVLASRRRSRD